MSIAGQFHIAHPGDYPACAFSADAHKKTVPANAVEKGWRVLDIGPQTVALFASKIKNAKTVVWNGPMGVFEMPSYAVGTTVFDSAATTSSSAGHNDISGLSNATRDIYYYGAFAYDAAGNYSVAASSAQGRATSYWLGDIADNFIERCSARSSIADNREFDGEITPERFHIDVDLDNPRVARNIIVGVKGRVEAEPRA